MTRPSLSPPPSSPIESVDDMSDVDESGYNTIRRTSGASGVKLLFSKSKVYIHPSPSAKDNIPGFIALVQQKSTSVSDARPSSGPAAASSLLLSWLPETALGDAYDTYVKVDLSDSASPPEQSYLVPPPPTTTAHGSAIGTYAFAVPVSEVFSLLVRPPSVGWWFGSVIINTRAGDSFPPLFFHDSECQSTILQRKKLARENFDPFGDGGGMFWGGDEVLRWLKRYVKVVRSNAEPSVYLIEPSQEDLLSFGQRSTTAKPAKTDAGSSGKVSSQQSSVIRSRDGGMDPLMSAINQKKWYFLDTMSRVTYFSRQAIGVLAQSPNAPKSLKQLMDGKELEMLQEFDSAKIYLTKWASVIAEQSEKDRKQRGWLAQDSSRTEDSTVGGFELLELEADSAMLDHQRKPVTMQEWDGFFNRHTKALHVTRDEVKQRIFRGGLDPDDGVRKEAWLFLLGVYDWDSSSDERQATMNSLRDKYVRLKAEWWGCGQENKEFREQKLRIEKDVHRTDRNIDIFAGEDVPHPDPDSPFADVGTNVHLEQMKDMLLTYHEYNKQLGYVQGMSDLLAPIYAVMQDDAVAFWCFVSFMERMERNFLRDQTGMRKQLLTLDQLVRLLDPELYKHLKSADCTNFFFFFRMLLVWYKREFEWADVLRLWEGLWTDYLSSNFHLFIALAILEKHRDVILTKLHAFDEVLKYVNQLSGQIDLESSLVRAEVLFRHFQRKVEHIDRQNLDRIGKVKSTRTEGEAIMPSVITDELRELLSRKVSKLDKPQNTDGTTQRRMLRESRRCA